MDLALAAIIIFYRHPKIFMWMTFWGFITAFSRPLTLGAGAWPEFAMRVANFALPLSLCFIYLQRKKKEVSETETIPAQEDIQHESA